MNAGLGAAAEELYGLPAADFTAARDRQAAAVKRAGDRELADAIKKLRRPTASAWLANHLVRTRPDEVGELLRLGAALRDTQARLDGDEIRRLSQEGQRVIAALSREARLLASEAGQPIGEAGVRELEDTLHAALADPGASDALRSGCLIGALHYSGFGMVDTSGTVALDAPPPPSAPPPPAGPPPSAPAPPRAVDAPTLTAPAASASGSTSALTRRRELKAAQQAVRAARAELTAARKAAADRELQVQQSRDRRQQLDQQVRQLTEQLEQLRAEDLDAASQGREADQAAQHAAQALEAAEAGLARAEADLERLQS